jgi:hypothetical protein
MSVCQSFELYLFFWKECIDLSRNDISFAGANNASLIGQDTGSAWNAASLAYF